MGGSGSNGWTPTVPSSPCERLAFRANINSPQAAAAGTLRLGDILDVKLQTVPHVAIVVFNGGVLVGTITGQHVTQLTHCLQNGLRYGATVVDISGGNWTVAVSHL